MNALATRPRRSGGRLAVGPLGARPRASLFGDPVLVVLVAPCSCCSALGLLHRPASRPADQRRRSTTRRCTRARAPASPAAGRRRRRGRARRPAWPTPAPYVALHPAGRAAGAPAPGRPAGCRVLEVSPRRWGRRLARHEERRRSPARGAASAGARCRCRAALPVLPADGAVRLAGGGAAAARAGRARTARAARATAPSSPGSGRSTPGDRLRRINWRVSLRTGDLHVVTTRPRRTAGVLLVVDALADHGRSGGIDGAASSLDVTVRAAAALAEHHVRARRPGVAAGDRAGRRERVGYGAGARHLRRLLGRLARVRPGEPRDARRRPAALPGHRRDRRDRALADAVRRGRHRHRHPGPARASR